MEKRFYSTKIYIRYSRVNFYDGATAWEDYRKKYLKARIVNLSCMPWPGHVP